MTGAAKTNAEMYVAAYNARYNKNISDTFAAGKSPPFANAILKPNS